jgi:hypothetical protein
MLATNGPRWFDRTTPEPRWQSIGISLLLTAAMFATALVAMRSIAPWHSAFDEPSEKPVLVRLTPPAPPREMERPKPPPAVAEPRVLVPTVVPSAIAPVVTPGQIDAPATPFAPATPISPVAPRTGQDSAGASGSPNRPPFVPGGVYAHGAPISRAGVVLPARTPNTQAVRDSILKVYMASVPELAKRPPTADVAAEMEERRRVAERMARRATTSGNPNVHVPMGQGADGVGVDGGPGNGLKMTPNGAMVSIPFPLFYPGPSPEQRKRNEAIYREYLAVLGRLQKRIATKRDSVLADSVRADSIARSRVKIVP